MKLGEHQPARAQSRAHTHKSSEIQGDASRTRSHRASYPCEAAIAVAVAGAERATRFCMDGRLHRPIVGFEHVEFHARAAVVACAEVLGL